MPCPPSTPPPPGSDNKPDARRDDGKPPASGDGKNSRKSFLLRLPVELHGELRSWATADFRSLNAHIEFLLRQAVHRRKGDGTDE